MAPASWSDLRAMLTGSLAIAERLDPITAAHIGSVLDLVEERRGDRLVEGSLSNIYPFKQRDD